MRRRWFHARVGFLLIATQAALTSAVGARPRYKHNLERYYGAALPANLDACSTCHLARPEAPSSTVDPPAMPPHNPFGARLRQLGQELVARGEDSTLPSRLRAAAEEDSDGDGVPNELEIVGGHAPGDPADTPATAELAAARVKVLELRRRQPAYAWRPFQPVARPLVPQVPRPATPAPIDPRGPIDAFIEDALLARGLEPRPEASKEVLLRRVSLDLTGLSPSPRELEDFAADSSPDAYEKVVDRLLASPSYGERWGRHWMDVWRYSDWAGWGEQVRDSQPHIWRWRDWIVESLNEDKPYDRMVVEMLAGDELAPLDASTLRATGYLARSFKLLSREAWMQEAVDHCAQAFLGLTAGCARCHDHMYDPISQTDYYQLRAFFEPYNVRLDRVPWEADTKRDGVARVFDAAPDVKTYLFIRGDDRRPDKEHPLLPGFPAALGVAACDPQAVSLPLAAYAPEKQESARAEALRGADGAVTAAREAFRAALAAAAQADEGRDRARQAELEAGVAAARRDALAAVLDVERLEDSGGQGTDAWKGAALKTVHVQRWLHLLEAQKESVAAQSAVADAQRAQKASSAPAAAGNAGQAAPAAVAASAEALAKAEERAGKAAKALSEAEKAYAAPPTTDYAKREISIYPAASTGRRTALARWIVRRENPLAARVAVNHIWLRHFGQALAPSVNDLGLNARAPTHPALLDWLAAELMEPATAGSSAAWSMKRIHRAIVTSSVYRRASTPDPSCLAADPDNSTYWRMVSRRLEAEAVRDNVLLVAGQLDRTLGGPELDHKTILATRRRSLYYRHAAEKQAEFLKVFDMAAVSECYERKPSIVPQQALALSNSELALSASRLLAREIDAEAGPENDAFVARAFARVLARRASAAETAASVKFLDDEAAWVVREEARIVAASTAATGATKPSKASQLRARESFVHALFNHNDFVTVR